LHTHTQKSTPSLSKLDEKRNTNGRSKSDTKQQPDWDRLRDERLGEGRIIGREGALHRGGEEVPADEEHDEHRNAYVVADKSAPPAC